MSATLALPLLLALLQPATVVAAPSPEPVELTLEQAIEHAKAHNAALAVGVAQALAAEERAVAAGKRDPIRFSLNPATILEQAGAFISDVLGLSNERKHASRVARHELAAILASNEEFELELVAAVKSTYWSIVLGTQALGHAEEEARLARRAVDQAERLGALGAASAAEVRDARESLLAADALLVDLRAEVAGSRAALALLLGLPEGAACHLTDAPAVDRQEAPSAPDLAVEAEARRPAMARVLALVDAAEAGVGLARTERRPELTVGGAFEELQLFGFADLEFPLLDFGSIRHTIRATEAERAAAAAEVEVLRQELRAEVASSLIRREAGLRALDLSTSQLALSQARLEAALRLHESGAAAGPSFMSHQVALHQAERAQLEALLEALAAEAALERAIGAPLAEVAAPREATDTALEEAMP